MEGIHERSINNGIIEIDIISALLKSIKTNKTKIKILFHFLSVSFFSCSLVLCVPQRSFCVWEHSLFKVTDAAVCALPLAVDTVS